MKFLLGQPLDPARPFLISGPCVIESEALCLEVGTTLRGIADRLGISIVFKASFDKANRTSGETVGSPGTELEFAL